jgi:hypothetical protein
MDMYEEDKPQIKKHKRKYRMPDGRLTEREHSHYEIIDGIEIPMPPPDNISLAEWLGYAKDGIYI